MKFNSQRLDWIKTHKLTTSLVLVIIWLVWQNQKFNFLPSFSPLSVRQTYPNPKLVYSHPSNGLNRGDDEVNHYPINAGIMDDEIRPSNETYSANETNSLNSHSKRLTVQNSSLSLLVKDVPATRGQIVAQAKKLGGWMITSSLNQPEQSPFAQITINVPSRKINQMLAYLRGQAIKVVSENLYGQDITDQYTNLQEHIAILEKTKTRYDNIRAQATKIADLITATRELTRLQTQIDYYQGQINKMERETTMSRISVYLATDEIALPYTPDQVFRPKVIFKLAVRSLVTTGYKLATKIIWLGVYSLVWLPLLLMISWAYRRNRRLHS